jgi:hypothetical protein
MDDDGEELYGCGALVVGVPAFLAAWIYAVGTYGWFLGGGLGWIPAFFIGVIVGLLWPLLLALAVLLFVALHKGWF